MDTKTDTTVTPLKRFLVVLPIFDRAGHDDEEHSGNEPDESLPWLSPHSWLFTIRAPDQETALDGVYNLIADQKRLADLHGASMWTSKGTKWARFPTTAISLGSPTSLRSLGRPRAFRRLISRSAVRARPSLRLNGPPPSSQWQGHLQRNQTPTRPAEISVRSSRSNAGTRRTSRRGLLGG